MKRERCFWQRCCFYRGCRLLFAVADLSVRQFAAVLVCAFVPTLVIQAVKMLGEAAA